MIKSNVSPVRSQRLARLLFLGCWIAFAAGAAEPHALSGTYKYVPGQSSDVAQAIDRAVQKMNFIKRPIARGRLTKTNVPYQRIRIEHSASEVEITFDERKPIRMPLDGRPIKWTREDGETFDVSATFDGDKLSQTYKAKDGTRVNVFSLDPEGSLHLRVDVSSPQLPENVQYALVYRRE